MNDDEPTPDGARKVIVGGLVVGVMMLTLGPIAGLVATVSGLVHVFDATSKVAAADKSTMLSAGIAESMSATSTGMIVAAMGGVLVLACAVLLWQRSKARQKH